MKRLISLLALILFGINFVGCNSGKGVNEEYEYGVRNIDSQVVNSFIENNKIVSISLHENLVSSKIIEIIDKDGIFDVLNTLDIQNLQFSYEYNGDKPFIELVDKCIEIGIISENLECCQSYFVSSDGVIYRKTNNVISYASNVASYKKLMNYFS